MTLKRRTVGTRWVLCCLLALCTLCLLGTAWAAEHPRGRTGETERRRAETERSTRAQEAGRSTDPNRRSKETSAEQAPVKQERRNEETARSTQPAAEPSRPNRRRTDTAPERRAEAPAAGAEGTAQGARSAPAKGAGAEAKTTTEQAAKAEQAAKTEAAAKAEQTTKTEAAAKAEAGDAKAKERQGEIVAKDGTAIKGYTAHGVDRAIGDTRQRAGTKPDAILDTLKNPTSVREGVDSQGRKFKVYEGKDSRVVVNPDTGRIISTNPKSRNGVRKS